MSSLDESKPGHFRPHPSSFSVLQRAVDAVLIVFGEYVAARLYPEAWNTDKTLAATHERTLADLERQMESLRRQADAALAEANSAWSQVAMAPSDEASQRWSERFKSADAAVRNFLDETSDISKKISGLLDELESAPKAPDQPS